MPSDSVHKCVHCNSNNTRCSGLLSMDYGEPYHQCGACGQVFSTTAALEQSGYEPISAEDQQFWSQF